MYKVLAWLADKNYGFRSFLYNLFIRNSAKSETGIWQRGWRRIILKNSEKPVQTKIHGYYAVVNCGYPYPVASRIHSHYNNPLVQLAYQTHLLRKRDISLVDVGASAGDTALLLLSNLPPIFKKFICVEGQEENYKYLCRNMQQFSNVECLHLLLSDSNWDEKNLVRIRSGSFSVQGINEIPAVALDEIILRENVESIDILKIDADGFDGKVLAGSKGALSKQKPQVIFEWHPILISETGNHFFQHFSVLDDCGYKKFLFFNKFGEFSHFMQGVDIWELEQLATLCLNNIYCNDWHYDVIALPDDLIDAVELAECSFAKNKKTAY